MELKATEIVKADADQACGMHHQINGEDEASSSNVQPIKKTNELSYTVIREKYLLLRLNSLKQATEKPVKSRIQRVPHMLRENKELEKYYKPNVLAIGPIHHGHPNYQYGEKMKRILAGNFLESHKIDAKVVYHQVFDNLEKLKMCYAEDVIENFHPDELAWMFLVDGCATLHFLDCFVQGDLSKLKSMNITSEQMTFARIDIFLLENQLPYQLLELLIRSVGCEEQKTIRNSISEYILISNIFLQVRKSRRAASSSCHLLDLLREEILDGFEKREDMRMTIINAQTPTFHNVKQLMVSGIRFDGTIMSSLNVNIQRGLFGTLRLPTVIIDEAFLPMILSLTSYEKCPDFENDKEVTSYICFLDSLIDHPNDVKVLIKNDVLINLFGSDEEIAKLFNILGNECTPNHALYAEVREDIEEHFRKTWKLWIYQLIKVFYDYWAILKVGAVLAILLTAVQTYFSLPLHKPKP